MRGKLQSFWIAGVIGVVVVVIVRVTHLNTLVPFVERLLDSPDALGTVALAVEVVTFWCLLGLLVRFLVAYKELAVVRLARQALESSSPLDWGDDLDTFLSSRIDESLYGQSVMRQRFSLLSGRLTGPSRSDRAFSLLGGQSAIDEASVHRGYAPLRALVWSLPTFGFAGTAVELSNAVGGLGAALSNTRSYDDLRNLLDYQVVPHLAGAFDITLFALASSVLCFFVLTLVQSHEEGTVAEADGVTLMALARMPEVTTELALGDLETQLGRLNATLAELMASGRGRWLGAIAETTVQMRTTLDSMLDELKGEWALVRRPQ